jgi:alpha-glucosidase
VSAPSGQGRDSRWWQNAVVYQIYPRSFQDSDGDGVGDVGGIVLRLDYIADLGVDAIWLSPIYCSPLADLGYDVSDHTAVDPRLGTLAAVDRLVAEAHHRGLRVLLDLVASHTSVEHPWFRLHPDWYIWADDRPRNNWRAAFGGPAWSRDPDSGRWYLHSFYPEQPDLDWRNPGVRAAMAEVVRFWLDRGVDGFRLDAAERLVKDPLLRDDPPATRPYPLPLHPEAAAFEHVHSRNDPEIGIALGALREAAGDRLLVGEVYLPTDSLAAYVDTLDLLFAFEVLHAPPRAEALRGVIEAAARVPGIAWVLSNHDFPRLATRFGPDRARVAAVLLLTLPGPAFVYQGDELGMPDGPGAVPPHDRAGRDAHRHPMQWTRTGGFTTGEPWIPMLGLPGLSVAEQEGEPASMLNLYRKLIALRRDLGPDLEFLDAEPGVLAYRRGGHVIAINLAAEARPSPVEGSAVLHTGGPEAESGDQLGAGEGVVVAMV